MVLLGAIAVYAGLGALIHLRDLPSIVVTLGMSFVWQGLAILLLPKPGGKAPDWLLGLMGLQAALRAVPDRRGARDRARGPLRADAQLLGRGAARHRRQRPGHRPRRLVDAVDQGRACSASPAFFGVLSGMALIGITTSADANIGNGYTLLSIAGVILGGGEFVGGRVSPVGAVIGALTLALAASPLLTFMHIPPDWQTGANGVILIVVLAARALIARRGA